MYIIDLEHTSDLYGAHCTNERQSASSVKIRHVNYKYNPLMKTVIHALSHPFNVGLLRICRKQKS